jgi:hypothetical protein
MASASSAPEIASTRHLSARTLLALEIAVLLALTACGLFYFFGKTFESGFAILPGDLGDWRYNNIIAEHWFSVLKGEARWRSPIFFYPAKGMLGYSDAIFLFVPFYIPFRLLGIDSAIAFALCFMSVIGFGFVSSYLFMSRILKLPKTVSFGASFAFAFSSMAAARYPHAALYANAFLPVLFGFGVWFFGSILARRASIIAGIGLSVTLALIFYTGFYTGYFAILFFIAFVTIFLVLNSALDWPSTKDAFRALWASRTAIAISALSFAVAIIPFLGTYLPAQRNVGGRDWGMVECMLPLPRDFLNVGGNAWWHWLVKKFPPETRPCGFELSFGVTPLTLTLFVLCLLWLGWKLRQARRAAPADHSVTGEEAFWFRVVLALGLAVLACWLVMLRLDFGSLWYLVYTAFPAATALRAIFRFQMVLFFIIMIVIGFTLPKIVAHWSRQWAPGIVTVVIAAIAIEQYNPHHLYYRGKHETEQLALAGAPPPSCRHFFVDSAGLENAPGHIPSLGGAMLAQRVGIPTLNGYSGSLPPGFVHSETRDPLYLNKVAGWVRRNNLLDGLCVVDLPRKSWHEMSAVLSDVGGRLLGKNVLSFEDRMQDFALQRVGFHGLERSGGAWTAGTASVEFSRPLAGASKVTVKGHRGYAGQPLTIRVDDQSLPVDPGTSDFRIEIATARPVPAVRIETDHFVPAAKGLGGDTRQLGVYVESIVLEK